MAQSIELPPDRVLRASELEAYWFPARDEFVRNETHNDLRVRVHRACRAIDHAELIDGDGLDPARADTGLILRWAALNALYARWDSEAGAPLRDRVALDQFTTQVAKLDTEGRIKSALTTIRPDVESLLENPFLIERFWAADEWENVRPQRGRMRKFDEELAEGRVASALQRVLTVVYFLRCQIIHGGATIGSSLNRQAAEPAARALAVLGTQLAALVVEHGPKIDWGELCYRPVE